MRAILRTRIISTHEGELLQAVMASPDEVRHADYPSTDVDAFIAVDKRKTLGFGRSLTRAALLNNDLKWFILALHHSTSDAWSMSKVSEVYKLKYEVLFEYLVLLDDMPFRCARLTCHIVLQWWICLSSLELHEFY